MPTTIVINTQHFNTLDLSPVQSVLEDWIQTGTLFDREQEIQFQIDYPQDPGQILELTEIDEIRLWFIRLDSRYPWLPYCLNWRTGELARYAAMMVPHEFSQREGIQFNEQALELFLMHKIFTIHHWLQQHGLNRSNTLKQMAGLFGHEPEDPLFALLNQYSA
jgi:hypothetical protein